MMDVAQSASLLEALEIDGGVISLVGAGGKKTAMYCLAGEHPGRVLLTSTAHMYPYEESKIDRLIEWEAVSTDFTLKPEERVVAVASRTDTPKRIGGLSKEQIAAVLGQHEFQLTVIKADGARARWIKAPAAHEPLIPSFSDLVVPIVSIKTIGRELDERIAHRSARLAEVTGAKLGELIKVEHLSALLSSKQGALKDVGDARVVPVLNMVDDHRLLALAIEVAERALTATQRFSRVLCASLKHGKVHKIIERES